MTEQPPESDQPNPYRSGPGPDEAHDPQALKDIVNQMLNDESFSGGAVTETPEELDKFIGILEAQLEEIDENDPQRSEVIDRLEFYKRRRGPAQP